jgi:amino-acid N-acetyltransferase
MSEPAQIHRRPDASEVRRLLTAAHLPTEDLTPAHFEHFFGCGPEQAIEGAVGIEILGEEALLRSLVVTDEARGRGYGIALVAAAEQDASACGVQRIYLLTTTVARFFARLGYTEIPRDDAPASVRMTSEFSSICPTTSVLMMKRLEPAEGWRR